MNKITILAISAVFVASILAITAFEAEAEPPSKVACPAENIQHWTNLFATTAGVLIEHNVQPSIEGKFFIPIPTMDSEILDITNAKQNIADRLNQLEYFVNDGGVRLVSESDVGIIEIQFNPIVAGYSTICAEN